MLKNLYSHRKPCFRGFMVLKGYITAILNEKSWGDVGLTVCGWVNIFWKTTTPGIGIHLGTVSATEEKYLYTVANV